MDNFIEQVKKARWAYEFFVRSEFPKHTAIKKFALLDNKIDILIDTDEGSTIYYIRDLYDFFDNHDIYCSINYKFVEKTTFIGLKDRLEAIKTYRSYLPEISDKESKEIISHPKITFDNRIDAELFAFGEAFKILNSMILAKQVKLK